MNDQTQQPQRVRFGVWLPTNRATLGGLTLPGWGVLLGGLIFMVMTFTRGWFALGLIALAVTLLFELVFVIRFGGDQTGRTIADRLSGAIAASGRTERGESTFNSGLFSTLPAEALTSLPGILANLREIDGTDGFGRPFTLLHNPRNKTLTAVLSCNADGTDMRTQAAIDRDVAVYGGWIASMSKDDALAGATVVVDSALRDKGPLVERIIADIDPDAPEIARRHSFEAGEQLPARYSEVSTWVTLTWSVPSLAEALEDAVAEVAAKLPYQVDALRDAGGGSVSVATSRTLAEGVRVAYSPDRSAEVASDALRGQDSGLRVTEAGPDYFDDGKKRICLHDGVASMTTLVLAPPRLHITEDTMAALFRPSERFLRKRVAIFYRPVSPSRTVQLVERMDARANTAATAKARSTASDRDRIKKAKKLEEEVVDGAAVTRFGMAVTVTFAPDARAYREAHLKLKSLLETSSLSYRFCEYDAGPAFHTTLPLGILPWLHETQIETAMKGIV
ncbi:hypothetical protein QMG83_15310 [Salinibacterium sp. G-O1]|uniref:SCO6880 family protein n=1 Tax=Salinibacterium sp. G-O1 TaxID=3046208 RepID=UPI0024B8F7F1|nr:SCO6880 family protein [Salinibacterium sp. G-O1]MDJ0336596.1 hypothetical protein [Salinibacterium sp. G-O1]